MGKILTLHVFVSGKVQGVWYRGWTVKEAAKLNLDGWVRNLLDGRVELLISGPSEAVGKLIKLLWEGPTGAVVTEVITKTIEDKPESGFVQLSTK